MLPAYISLSIFMDPLHQLPQSPSSLFSLTLIASILMATAMGSYAGVLQEATNKGLSAPQNPATLPRSFAAVEMPARKAKQAVRTRLEPDSNGNLILRDGWEMSVESPALPTPAALSKPGFNTANWHNATVPGTVLTTLVDQGLFPDPYFGLNNLAIPDTLCRTPWWYRIAFVLPPERYGKRTTLEFEGINYAAEVWFNGRALGQIKGAFIRGIFDITGLLQPSGENILAVRILPPPNPGIPHEQSAAAGMGPNGGQLCLDGPTFISSEGWDWIPGIRDRNIGIWQDVKLRFSGEVRLEDPQVITILDLPDTTTAYLSINAGIKNMGDQDESVLLRARIEDVEIEQEFRIGAGQLVKASLSPEHFEALILQNPRLWWPNGYGHPELYRLELQLTDQQGLLLDRTSLRFGIRELSYELNVDAPGRPNRRVEYRPVNVLASGKPFLDNLKRREVIPGTWIPGLMPEADTALLSMLGDPLMEPFLVIRVNGRRIFCKGGNWGMDDGMKRVSRERLEPYMRLHRDANFNMVRNWTGESTEAVFYELCDEYGMLVWNDFWMSTEGYNLYPMDEALFLANARDVVLRFRNHPSIAIWCPRNEGFAQPGIEEGLAAIVAAEDGTRLYQGNSRHLNLRPSGPWNYFPDPSQYFVRESGAFNTEMGTASVPTAETIRKFIAPEDLWPIGDVWHYHDLHIDEASTWAYQKEYLEAIDSDFGQTANSLDEFCRRAQFINYRSHRAMFESWNSRLWQNSSGLLLWMSHPAWPSMVWQTYSWDYETHGSYFGSKKACEPLHIQMNLPDQKIVAVNTSLRSFSAAHASLNVHDLTGVVIHRQEVTIDFKANSLTECFNTSLPESALGLLYFRLQLRDADGRVLSENAYWHNPGNVRDLSDLMTVPQVGVSGSMAEEAAGRKSMRFVLTNKSEHPAVDIKMNLRSSGTDEAILPAFFSEGYFTLLPGESRIIELNAPAMPATECYISAEGFNVPRIPIVKIP